ncbi:TRAP-type mannitol/chloroaromatic compound transport system, small permease component [Salinihabitans flavidus]|uniref:TRAP transporter small permease protein n=1 Tax=Salinihabitans flavidus TaxID=569882 RepID=A0A1H8RBE1_9RHOB|nr:TRAP transporter small permease [Salinihabitans flavidus]SEO63765.1 TRAP-type mannitol/chloroaromatic compound transport system, small permease component [Salinihabitans flavidus]
MTEQSTNGGSGLPPFSQAPVGATLGLVAAFLSSVGTIWIGLLMLLIVADVLGRNFLNAPITGVSEIAGRSVVAIVFLQVSAAIMQGRLTRADFLIRRIGRWRPEAVQTLETVFALTGALVFALIVWASWSKTLVSWTSAEYFGVQGVFTIPTFPFRAITVIGAGIAVLACLYRTSETIRHFRSADR